jgi:hypothetical protein
VLKPPAPDRRLNIKQYGSVFESSVVLSPGGPEAILLMYCCCTADVLTWARAQSVKRTWAGIE